MVDLSPDFNKITASKQRIRDVWAYRKVDHLPVFIRISGRSGHTRREIIENDELQYKVSLDNLMRSLRCLPDDYIPYARVWFGYMTIATMFGLPIHWGDDLEQSPGVEHPLITQIDQIYQLTLPNINAGLMADNLRVQRMFVERFPEWVHLTGFDLGGPLNTCRDLVETNLLYIAMLEQPDALNYLLNIIDQVLISCYEATIEASGGLERLTCIDMAQIWAPEGHKGFISDDICATIKPDLFRKFSIPHNNAVFQRWPGGLLHNCGPHPAAFDYLDHNPPIDGINCSFFHTRSDFPKLRKAFSGKGLVQVMFDNNETADEMVAGYRYMMETLAPDVIGLPIPIVNDSWSDSEITDLYYEMRQVGCEYASNMRWREGN